MLYHQKIDTGLRNHDLEETVFHESVHATLDDHWSGSKTWRIAQAADKGFITNYARSKPNGEDMAEPALFAYAELITPGRLPENVSKKIRQIMPNRLESFEKLYGSMQPLHQKMGSAQKC